MVQLNELHGGFTVQHVYIKMEATFFWSEKDDDALLLTNLNTDKLGCMTVTVFPVSYRALCAFWLVI